MKKVNFFSVFLTFSILNRIECVVLNRELLESWYPDLSTRTNKDLSVKGIVSIEPNTFNILV